MFLEFLLFSCLADYIDNMEYDMRLQQAEQEDTIEDLYDELFYLREKVKQLETKRYK